MCGPGRPSLSKDTYATYGWRKPPRTATMYVGLPTILRSSYRRYVSTYVATCTYSTENKTRVRTCTRAWSKIRVNQINAKQS